MGVKKVWVGGAGGVDVDAAGGGGGFGGNEALSGFGGAVSFGLAFGGVGLLLVVFERVW